MTPQDFVDKWRPAAGREMGGYVEHFLDLCRVVGHETPMEADPSQSFSCFQKSVKKGDSQQGFADVKNRTLTNLYNERPTWLDNAHRKLDEAVFAAYGWPADLTREEVLERLLALNQERAAQQAIAQPGAP
jgi:hypothetical protein